MCSPIEEHHNIFIESFNCIFSVLQIENRAINENIAGTITIMIPAFSILKIAPFFFWLPPYSALLISLCWSGCVRKLFLSEPFLFGVFFFRVYSIGYSIFIICAKAFSVE